MNCYFRMWTLYCHCSCSQRRPGAASLAAIQSLAGRIDILEAEQFIATNIYERSLFKASELRVTVERLIKGYNAIIDQCETDPSLRVRIGG